LETSVGVFLEGRHLERGKKAFCHQTLGVSLAKRGESGDGGVHPGLGKGWVVRLVVAAASVTHNMHNHVPSKALAKSQSDSASPPESLGIIAVDVEDGNIKPPHAVRRIATGVGLLGGGCKTHLIVEEDVQGAVHPIAFQAP
jgi:hypothetical protein